MAAPTAASHPSFRPPFIPTEPLARWAAGSLVATVVVSWVAAGVELHQLHLLGQGLGQTLGQSLGQTSGEAVTPAQRAAFGKAWRVVFSIRAALLVLTAATFLTWLWHARVNLRAMGVRKLRWPRHWVVTGYLIPFLNFFLPYQVVREVWQGSAPENLDPFAWRSIRAPSLLNYWWGGFVAWLALEGLAVLLAMGSTDTVARLRLLATVRLLAHVAAAATAFLAIFLVGRIDEAQERKRARQLEDEAAEGGGLAGAGVPAR